jgi:hypothetical protein
VWLLMDLLPSAQLRNMPTSKHPRPCSGLDTNTATVLSSSCPHTMTKKHNIAIQQDM